MSEELNLVRDLAVILISAGIFTIISKALKQPLILGYIVAGFLVGPHFNLFPNVTGVESVDQWSEIGIIFLLFALGLEFSFKKLLKVGSSALITAGCVCIGMFVIGMTVGQALGWTSMESIFLGGLMSMSSTTIIIKAYNDLGLKSAPQSALVFGTLVVEDLIAVVLMVFLTTLATANKFAGGEMLLGLAKLLFFLVLWFLVGIFAIPSLLKRTRKYLSDEILLIISIGLCFGMVVLANYAGFSSALGAFVMGSILAETIESEHISKLVVSIKDLFGAIFFVSVGMMIDPAVIAEHWLTILILSLVTAIGMTLFGTFGALLSGRGLNVALHTGFSLAQLGEFSFIIAGLGVSLGVMRGFIYPVIIAVSVITTFTTPYMIKAADPVSKFLYSRLSPTMIARLDSAPDKKKGSSKKEQSLWRGLLKKYLIRIVTYGVILVAIFLGSKLYLDKAAYDIFPGWSQITHNFFCTGVTLAVMLPFLLGLAVNGSAIKKDAAALLAEKDSNVWPVMSLVLIRILIAIGFVVAVIAIHFSLSYWSILLIAVAGVAFFLIARKSLHSFKGIEERFMSNLNAKEEIQHHIAPILTGINSKMCGHDVAAEPVEVSPACELVGMTLREAPLRQRYGINVAKIVRGGRRILIPSPDEKIYPYDELLAVGTRKEVSRFMEDMRLGALDKAFPEENDDVAVEPYSIKAGSYLDGKFLRETDLRQRNCMVIGVVRGEESVMNPKADFRFTAGDIVWLAGSRADCEAVVS